MQKRHLNTVVLVSAAFMTLPAPVSAQILVSGNDEKILWDDAGQAVLHPPGKDTISFIQIGDRESLKIVTSVARENSIIGPPTNLAVSPNGEIALVANSVTLTKDGEKWKSVPDNKVYVFDLTRRSSPAPTR